MKRILPGTTMVTGTAPHVLEVIQLVKQELVGLLQQRGKLRLHWTKSKEP